MTSQIALKIALIGCGRIFHKHIEAIKALNNKFKIVGICDIDVTKAHKAEELTHVKSFSNFAEMIKTTKPDVVSIMVPNGMHPKFICDVVDLDVKNIICEKPLSIDLASGKRAFEYCKTKNTRLFLIYQNRFNAPIVALKKAIDDNQFGRINFINANVFWQRPQEYYDKDASWHGSLNMDGGAYLTQASHYVDMVNYISNSKPISIYAKLATLARNIETEDTGSVIIEFANKSIANINMTVLTYPKNLEGSITVLGNTGTVKIGGVAMNEIISWDFEDKNCQHQLNNSESLNDTSVYGSGHTSNYEDIYLAIVNKTPANVEGETIILTQAILSSIYDSNKSKQPVNF